MFELAMHYQIQRVPIPLTVPPSACFDSGHWRADPRPPELAVSANGTIAYIDRSSSSRTCPFGRVVLIDTSGHVHRLPAIPLSLVARIFGADPGGMPLFIERIRMANDGTPFVTVFAQESGAVTVELRHVFRFADGAWSAISVPAVAALNSSIGAALSRDHYTVDADYAGTCCPDIDRMTTDPAYWADESSSTSAGYPRIMERFMATAQSTTALVGFSGLSMLNHREVPRVIEFSARGQRVLGTGVPLAVNVHGDVVGDNRGDPSSDAEPTLWTSSGATIRIASEAGSAFAIADDGTIVGVAGDHAFIASFDGTRMHFVRPLDTLLPLHSGWHVLSAFALTSASRIVAIGSYRGGPVEIVRLVPVDRRR